jgi:hypothetical protein
MSEDDKNKSAEEQPAAEVGFVADAKAEGEDSRPKSRPGPGSTRRSSFFDRARSAFLKSDETYTDVETLRGTKGADFEGPGRVFREGGCLCFGGGGVSEGKKDVFLLIKGPFCFVFANEEAPSPKYAIGLQNMRAEVKPASLGRFNVFLQDLGEAEFEVSFDQEERAKTFAAVVKVQSSKAETEEIRKRLGHGHLLSRHASIRYAEEVGKKKTLDQPEKPITAGEVADVMGTTAMEPY